MEDAYVIRGGKKLNGEVTLSGAKNVALKTIIAALMFDSKVILKNIPRINDVIELIHLVSKLGVKTKLDGNTLEIDSSNFSENRVDLLHASRIRVSFMLFAPLLHKFGRCFIPNPGGCRLGARPIDRIIDGMRKLGIDVKYNHDTGYYEASINGKSSETYTFDKPSHTGTELLVMLSLFGNGKTVLKNTALEPEVDEFIYFLNQSGILDKFFETHLINIIEVGNINSWYDK